MTQSQVLIVQHVPWEKPGRILDNLDDLNMSSTVVNIAKEKKPDLPDFAQVAGLVIMGGPMGALDYDKYPGLKVEAKLVKAAISVGKPVLGVCLGHQAICEAFGGRIEHAQQLMHGKQSEVTVDPAEPLFTGLPEKVKVARYHSLVAAPDVLPDCLKVISRDERGEIMAVRHRTMPIYGVQFHPESILTPQGTVIMKNFLNV